MIERVLISTLLAVTLTVSANAAAADEFVPRAEGSRISAGVDVWPASHQTTVAADVAAQIGIGRGFALDLEVPWAWIHASAVGFTGGGDGGDFGNILLGGHGIFRLEPHLALSAGLTFSMPTRLDLSTMGAAETSAAVGGSLIRGAFDVPRYFPGYFSVRVPLGLEAQLDKLLHFRAELTPVFMIPVAKYGGDTKLVFLEHADELEVRSEEGFGAGLRFQVALGLNDGGLFAGLLGNNPVQTAIEPFIGYEPPKSGVFVRIGGLLALNTPMGFAFDENKLRVIRTQIGAKF